VRTVLTASAATMMPAASPRVGRTSGATALLSFKAPEERVVTISGEVDVFEVIGIRGGTARVLDSIATFSNGQSEVRVDASNCAIEAVPPRAAHGIERRAEPTGSRAGAAERPGSERGSSIGRLVSSRHKQQGGGRKDDPSGSHQTPERASNCTRRHKWRRTAAFGKLRAGAPQEGGAAATC
jgi:hypothetical protein